MTTKEAFVAIKKLLFDTPPPPVPTAPIIPAAAAAATDYPLADGTILSIDKLAVGGMVTIANAAAPDNTYTLADGTTITTVVGMITALTPMEMAAPDLPIDMVTQAVLAGEVAKVHAHYEKKFASQTEGLKQLVALVEIIAATEVAKPAEKAKFKKYEEMTNFEKLKFNRGDL